MPKRKERQALSPTKPKIATSASKNKAGKLKTTSRMANNGNGAEDWLTSLVQQSAAESGTQLLSKEDRKRKREAKKARREQQKQQQTNGRKRPRDDEKKLADDMSKFPSDVSKRRLRIIASAIDKVRQELYGNGEVRPRLYDTKIAAKTVAATTKKRRRQWSEESIQPRPSDYSGIGLARDSLYIEFIDPSCLAKLEEEFQEHIPGFFGKQRTKAMKRQSDGSMLWRQLADNRQHMSKKLKGMNPDQRVQAMIDAGMI
ncbi:hypothetical protein IV203_002860 [Nitzschia inconspicua]|uniref:Uncharacterized protein n=1 Tax=Nitzschia inconspicua TaxID=303405 RepID=A0A9K3L2E9_9STRA|nr:hypothetical protein IV203_002860 [Nitzschia inconspicua]